MSAGEGGAAEPTRPPLTINVRAGEHSGRHPIYLVVLAVPTLDKHWTVSYRFGNFKELRAALGPDASKISSQFPKDAMKSKFGAFGVHLSESENRERASILDAWICEARTQLRALPCPPPHVTPVIAHVLVTQLTRHTDLPTLALPHGVALRRFRSERSSVRRPAASCTSSSAFPMSPVRRCECEGGAGLPGTVPATSRTHIDRASCTRVLARRRARASGCHATALPD